MCSPPDRQGGRAEVRAVESGSAAVGSDCISETAPFLQARPSLPHVHPPHSFPSPCQLCTSPELFPCPLWRWRDELNPSSASYLLWDFG